MHCARTGEEKVNQCTRAQRRKAGKLDRGVAYADSCGICWAWDGRKGIPGNFSEFIGRWAQGAYRCVGEKQFNILRKPFPMTLRQARCEGE